MWINKNKLDDSRNFLFGRGDTPESQDNDFFARFVKPISEWAKSNPQSHINIWYDAEMVSEKIIQNTEAAVRQELSGNHAYNVIRSKNVREIAAICENRDVYDRAEVYWRVDLLKLAIPIHLWKEENYARYCINVDLDVRFLTKDQIFDEPTKCLIDKFGFVMASGGCSHLQYENNFQILDGENPLLKKAIKLVILDKNIEKARNHILGGSKPSETSIYPTYRYMFAYVLYNHDEHLPLECFDDYSFREIFTEDDWKRSKQICKEYGRNWMPTKPVEAPLSRWEGGRSEAYF
jgi:hypothetical protein